MARKPRVEYEGAIYHVMSRGDRGEKVYSGDDDMKMFLDTLEQACERTGWLIHAFVLMKNHYHLLLETPEPNLLAGMHWLQGTYTCRFNVRHGMKGHLFQGRYKALLVEADRKYFTRVSDYIHLNPVRAHVIDLNSLDVQAYQWSSYPLYLVPSRRPEWLVVERTLDGLGISDTREGRLAFRKYIQRRSEEAICAEKEGRAELEWEEIRSGWAFGSEEFRERITEMMEDAVAGTKRDSYSGELVRKHNARQATELVDCALREMDLCREDLPLLKKSDQRKKALAWLLKKHTVVKNEWIATHLYMGTPSNISRMIKEADSDLIKMLEKMLKK